METIHTGAAAITFPTTPEAFIAYQEQLAGRKLAEHEREVTAAWVEVFNHAHTKGLCRDSGAPRPWTSWPDSRRPVLPYIGFSGRPICGFLSPGNKEQKGAFQND